MELVNESEEQVKEEFRVVVNHEEQYSIWPTYKEIPLGWKDVGVSGSERRLSRAYREGMDRYPTVERAVGRRKIASHPE